MSDLNNFQPKLQELYTEGDALSNDLTNEEKIAEINGECNIIKKSSNDVRKQIKENLEKYVPLYNSTSVLFYY